jgi:hypothetical protein
MNNKRISKGWITTLLVILIILVWVIPVSAKAVRIDIHGTTCIQTQSPPARFWISEDGIVHSRGIILSNIDLTESPYDTGPATMMMNVDVDPVTGYGHGYGTFTIYPSAYNGTWEGHWSTHISPDGVKGSAVGHGTGELEGFQIFNDMSSTNPFDPCTISDITVLLP